VSLRFAGPIPSRIAERLREVGAQVEPALQLRRNVPLSNFYEALRSVWRMIPWAAVIITITVLLLYSFGTRRAAASVAARVFGRVMRRLSIGTGYSGVMSHRTAGGGRSWTMCSAERRRARGDKPNERRDSGLAEG
jgi:hypothetical protein